MTKIAIACTGLEHVRRGFESFAVELHNSLVSNNIDLIKGSGASEPTIHALPTLKRNSKIYNIFPFNITGDFHRYRNECYSFGFSLLPALLQNKYDLIHTSDWLLGDFLLSARQRLNLKFKVLLSNGAPYEAKYCSKYDAVQQVALPYYLEGQAIGIPSEKNFLVPYGFDAARLTKPVDFNCKAFRAKYHIPEEAFVVVSLAALNYHHKRIDWLIQEFSRLDHEEFYLIMAGQREAETPKLEELASQSLPQGNYQFLTLPYSEVPELLWATDLMILCSLYEGFGRVLCEAMAAELPILVHPHATSQWIFNHDRCFVDMTIPDHLQEKIQELAHSSNLRCEIAERNQQHFLASFDWRVLSSQYLDMYEKVISTSE